MEVGKGLHSDGLSRKSIRLSLYLPEGLKDGLNHWIDGRIFDVALLAAFLCRVSQPGHHPHFDRSQTLARCCQARDSELVSGWE